MPQGEFEVTYSAICPVCGAYGLHGCTGVRTSWVAPPVDWNRLITVAERLVAVLEKIGERVVGEGEPG